MQSTPCKVLGGLMSATQTNRSSVEIIRAKILNCSIQNQSKREHTKIENCRKAKINCVPNELIEAFIVILE